MERLKFRATYEVSDGYVGPSAPHHVTICADDLDLEGDESDQEIKDFFWAEIRNHFDEHITPVSKQEDEFVEWVKSLKK